MLNPVLILCMTVWFLAAVYLFVCVDLCMLDTDQRALRENIVRMETVGLNDFANQDRQQLQTYPRKDTAIIISVLLAVFTLIGALLLGMRADWRDNLSTPSRIAVLLTFVYVAFLTTQSWVTVKLPMLPVVVVTELLLALATFVLLLVTGTRNEQV